MARLTATEVARSFSAILNRVAGGEEIEVVRNGAAVAVISPPREWLVSADRFRQILASLPSVDEEFAKDVRELRASVPPEGGAWPS